MVEGDGTVSRRSRKAAWTSYRFMPRFRQAPLTPFRPAPLRQQVRLRTAAPQVAIVVFPEGLRAGVVMPIEIPHPAKCRRSAGLDLLILRDQEPPFLNVVPINRPIEAVVPHLNPPRTG